MAVKCRKLSSTCDGSLGSDWFGMLPLRFYSFRPLLKPFMSKVQSGRSIFDVNLLEISMWVDLSIYNFGQHSNIASVGLKALLSYVKKLQRSSAIKILNPRPPIKNDERRLLTDIFSPEDDL